jgi:hypothetical protein
LEEVSRSLAGVDKLSESLSCTDLGYVVGKLASGSLVALSVARTNIEVELTLMWTCEQKVRFVNTTIQWKTVKCWLEADGLTRARFGPRNKNNRREGETHLDRRGAKSVVL